jgi:16S rRNA (cytosine1402-N4)-methyltransferase
MHKSVLLEETLEYLKVGKGSVIVDGTLGGGGHSEALCKRNPSIHLIGLDQDEDAFPRAEKRLKDTGCTYTLIHSNFRNIDTALESVGIDKVDGVLLDLGVSSFQLDSAERGFSFMRDEPLQMTMKKEITPEDVTAYDIVNSWGEETIITILKGYGEERYAKAIAKAIVKAREQGPIERTLELVDIILGAVPRVYLHGKIHPATRTFQSIRIATNDELGALEEGIRKGFEALKPGGRLVAISFHSSEDRIVKRFFQEMAKDEKGILVTKKPVIPTEEEQKENTRSRSAKLRVIEKI